MIDLNKLGYLEKWLANIYITLDELPDAELNVQVVTAIQKSFPDIYEKLKVPIEACMEDASKTDFLLSELRDLLEDGNFPSEVPYLDTVTINRLRDYKKYNRMVLKGRACIFEFVKKKNIPIEDVCVCGSYVLFLHGLRDYFNDVDVALPRKYIEMFEFDIDKRCEDIVVANNTVSPKYNFGMIDLVFQDPKDTDYTISEIGGFKIATLEWILEIKQNLNRGKDQLDILKIKERLNSKIKSYQSW